MATTYHDLGPVARIRVRRLIGPAFIAAVAYVDPGNFASNFEAGALFGYRLLWVLILANLMAMVVQYTSAKVGLATGRSLPELCRARFGVRTNRTLWLQAEVMAMTTDLAEFVGSAVGLRLLFGLPLLLGGAITAVVSIGMLMLRRRGLRHLQLAVVGMLAIVLAGFVVQTAIVTASARPSTSDFLRGLTPALGGDGQTGVAIAIIGATVMPHVIYLHSALTQDLDDGAGRIPAHIARRMIGIDTLLALGLAGLINASMLAIAAGAFSGTTGATASLAGIYAQLNNRFGDVAAGAFAVALAASGLASSGVGTYAGQVVMQGFTNLRVPLWFRRTVTMLPALVVLATGLEPGQVLLVSQMVLSLGIPFALIPLLLVAADRSTMGAMVSSRASQLMLGSITALIVYLNSQALVSLVRQVVQ